MSNVEHKQAVMNGEVMYLPTAECPECGKRTCLGWLLHLQQSILGYGCHLPQKSFYKLNYLNQTTMKKSFEKQTPKEALYQITVADERWYTKPGKDPISGIPVYTPVPSVTWIAGFWPKGIGFYKWLADKGWDEAQASKRSRGGQGFSRSLGDRDDPQWPGIPASIRRCSTKTRAPNRNRHTANWSMRSFCASSLSSIGGPRSSKTTLLKRSQPK